MSPPRLFVVPTALANGRAYLDAEARRYLITVLRLDVGSAVTILDGEGGLYPGTVALIGKQDVVCDLGEMVPAGGEPERDVHLWLALLKGEKMDWVVQKATELGVSAIHLMATERSVAHPSSHKLDRWRRIAREAAEQCERGRVPRLLESRPLANRSLPLGTFYCAERRPEMPSLRAAAQGRKNEALHVLVGPEGGWSDGEVAMLHERGAEPVSLGPRILRAETAALVALTMLLLD
jgi:16S rRNA (uracil1498-N3)-methyltransferase